MTPIQRAVHERLLLKFHVLTHVITDEVTNRRRTTAEVALLKQKIFDRRDKGNTIEAIAKELRISTRTVREHLSVRAREGNHHKR